MRTSRLVAILVSFLLTSAIIATRAEMRRSFLPSAADDNSPPVAADDAYTIHGSGKIGPVLQNDYDPNGDGMTVQVLTFPTRGRISGAELSYYSYQPTDPSYTGQDSFTYRACDPQQACSNSATVFINIVNQAPVAGADTFTVHGVTTIGPMMANDFDPDGDPISFTLVTGVSHGTLAGLPQPDMKRYTPHIGYTGVDNFTYQVCDQFGLCSQATVTLHVNNIPPVAGPDQYVVRGTTIIGPFFANDYDPDGDTFNGPSLVVGASHGTVYGLAYPTYPSDVKQYVPHAGYSGVDSFQYEICDPLGACSTATVTFFVLGDGANDGAAACNARVGQPVNVTNGNMYLQQSDYQLPSVGYPIDVTRTYNSNAQRIGIFGRGWSTAYDESLTVYDGSMVRLSQADGRASHFGRPLGSSGIFQSLEGDFHGQLAQAGGGFTLTIKNGYVHRFDSSGKLLSLSDRNNNTTTLAYDANGLLTSVTDPFGRVLTVTTNANGQVASLNDAMGVIASYTYGAGNELLSVTYPDNSAFQFTYDGNFRLTTVTDALGNVVESHTYDGQGRALTSARDGGVEHYTLNYVSETQTDVTDALGRLTTFTVDKSKGRNLVTRVEGLCSCGGSQVQTWTYDDQLNVTSKTDALNHVTTFTYDPTGNRLTETDATGTVTYIYNQFGEVLTRTNQLNGVTSNTFDGAGSLLTTTNALGKTTSFSYDPRGLVLTATDARGKVTSFAYDGGGNLQTRTDALGHETKFDYDLRGKLIAVTNALGHQTQFAHDPAGRLIRVTRPDTTSTIYEYDLAGRLTAMIDAKGNRSTLVYDNANRLTSETDALNQSTSYEYDLVSNLTSRTDALGRVTNYEYDDFNRLKKTTLPPATQGATRLFETFAYDAAGNVTHRTDTAGRVTSFAYDAADRVTSSTDADSKLTSLEYDALSRTTALVDAKNQRYRFNYDALGQLRHVRRGASVMSFTYDSVGNRKTRTDYNGAQTNYSYDALNRLKTITYPDTTTVGYTYDKLSRLQTATNANGTIDFDYNKMNRLTSVTDVFGQVVDYNYDANGNRTKLTLNGAVAATYRYDAGDRLTKLLDSAGAVFNFTYDVTNKLTSQKAPNGVTASDQYDGLDRLTGLTNKKGLTTIADFQYQLNDAHNISQITDSTGINGYTYDALDRLTAATHGSQPTESFSYDAVGNRTASHLSSTYTHQPFNRLVSTATATYSYDTNGNQLSRTDPGGTTQYAWDFENRLTQVTVPDGTEVRYKYDPLGRRIERNVSSSAPENERFIYDGADVIRDIDQDGLTLKDYLNGPGIDNKLRQTAGTAALYFVQDHLGTTRALTGSTGNVVEQLQYDSFGNSAGSALTRYGYTGRESDADTGLLYYRARWYDPQLGRFISEDPIGLAGGINSFTYVSNSSLNKTDPFGLYDIDVHYYLTYYLALRSGCFTDGDARTIANGNWDSDLSDWKKPAWGNSISIIGRLPAIVPDYSQQHRNVAFHAFGTTNENSRRAAELLSQASLYGGNPFLFGTYLHFLQDSFSHRAFAGNKINGHLSAFHSADHTRSNPRKSMEMAHATFDALRDFGKRRGCECNGQPDWKVVRDFVNVGYEPWSPLDNADHTDSQLRKKIQILGVPWRSQSGY